MHFYKYPLGYEILSKMSLDASSIFYKYDYKNNKDYKKIFFIRFVRYSKILILLSNWHAFWKLLPKISNEIILISPKNLQQWKNKTNQKAINPKEI